MPRFTIVANTQKPVLYLDFQGETSGQLFDNLLTGNPKSTSVPKLLMASEGGQGTPSSLRPSEIKLERDCSPKNQGQ